MNRVSAPEFELLTIARAVVGQAPVDEVAPMLRAGRPPPPKLGPVAMRLLRDTLAKGAVLELVRRGGWRRVRALSGEKLVQGRLWERHAAPALHFSALSMAALQWMNQAALDSPDCPALEAPGEATPADELVLYLSCALLAGSGFGATVARQAAFRRSALCCLGFPDVLGRAEPLTEVPAFRLEGTSLILLEALQGDLARRWATAERAKGDVFHPEELQRIGASQEQVLDRFISAASAGRRDLCTFLVDAAVELFRLGFGARSLVAQLDPHTSLRERTLARGAAGAFWRAVLRLRQLDQEHRVTRVFDEHYAAAQMLLSEWERLGEAGFRRAEALVRELESLEISDGEFAAAGGTP